jgi:hypothetical protein
MGDPGEELGGRARLCLRAGYAYCYTRHHTPTRPPPVAPAAQQSALGLSARSGCERACGMSFTCRITASC